MLEAGQAVKVRTYQPRGWEEGTVLEAITPVPEGDQWWAGVEAPSVRVDHGPDYAAKGYLQRYNERLVPASSVRAG